LDPDQIQKIKTHVASRLSTAYNLDKMRRAIDKLKQSIGFEKELEESLLDDDDSNNDDDINDNDEDKKKKKAKRVLKAKRVAIKKEKVEFENRE
jgi:hypothetical protein